DLRLPDHASLWGAVDRWAALTSEPLGTEDERRRRGGHFQAAMRRGWRRGLSWLRAREPARGGEGGEGDAYARACHGRLGRGRRGVGGVRYRSGPAPGGGPRVSTVTFPPASRSAPPTASAVTCTLFFPSRSETGVSNTPDASTVVGVPLTRISVPGAVLPRI